MEDVSELRLELSGYIAILYSCKNNMKLVNNIDAYSYEGKKLWNIKEVLENSLGVQKDEWYPEMSIVEGNLSVLSFRGIRFLIDGQRGNLLGSQIVK